MSFFICECVIFDILCHTPPPLSPLHPFLYYTVKIILLQRFVMKKINKNKNIEYKFANILQSAFFPFPLVTTQIILLSLIQLCKPIITRVRSFSEQWLSLKGFLHYDKPSFVFLQGYTLKKPFENINFAYGKLNRKLLTVQCTPIFSYS